MELQSINNENTNKTKENLTFSKKKVSKQTKKLKKIILNVLEKQNLEVRGLELSPDGKYLISCSEHLQDEAPEVLVWNIDELLEGENTPEGKLEGESIKNPNLINNF